jgi:hypothetical protein
MLQESRTIFLILHVFRLGRDRMIHRWTAESAVINATDDDKPREVQKGLVPLQPKKDEEYNTAPD